MITLQLRSTIPSPASARKAIDLVPSDSNIIDDGTAEEADAIAQLWRNEMALIEARMVVNQDRLDRLDVQEVREVEEAVRVARDEVATRYAETRAEVIAARDELAVDYETAQTHEYQWRETAATRRNVVPPPPPF